MAAPPIPFTPIRWSLYDPAELFTGFVPADPSSYQESLDFRIYRHFVSEGGSTPGDHFVAMMQALHDNSITQAVQQVRRRRRIAGIMGAHGLDRDAPGYREIAELARLLARAGVLVCTGGGPGAMEAAHLGAAHAPLGDGDLGDAIRALSAEPKVPDLRAVVASDGSVDRDLVAQGYRWLKPAYDIAQGLARAGAGESLAVPTWQYGSEPSTPFATMIGKYFQNSIREDGLLAVARQGVVFSPGTAGTVQEIFQNAAQNVYRSFGPFSPMVFLGREHWRTACPVDALLRTLLDTDDYAKFVLVTDDIAAAASFIEKFGNGVRLA